jgi:class 3 adenylate cyclase
LWAPGPRGGEILIGESTYQNLQAGFRIEKKGSIKLKNKIRPVPCYRVLPEP